MAKKADAKKAAALVMGNCARECNNRGLPLDPRVWKIRPEHIAQLVEIVGNGLISAKIASDIFPSIFESGEMPEEHVKRNGLGQISDSSELERVVEEIVKANPSEAEAYRGGKKKLMSFFVGQVMRATKGKANPALVNGLLEKKLGG